MGQAFRFDSESDVAALVYGPDDQPDELLAAFAADLVARGFDAVGFVQRRSASPSWSRPCPELICIPTGASMGFIQPGAGDSPFGDRATTLPDAQAWLLAAIDRKPDLVLINRFGTMEQSGGGLAQVVVKAAAAGAPVLLAAPRALFGDWLRFSEGLAVLLDCRRESLDQWWRSLGRSPLPRAEVPTVCEQYK